MQDETREERRARKKRLKLLKKARDENREDKKEKVLKERGEKRGKENVSDAKEEYGSDEVVASSNAREKRRKKKRERKRDKRSEEEEYKSKKRKHADIDNGWKSLANGTRENSQEVRDGRDQRNENDTVNKEGVKKRKRDLRNKSKSESGTQGPKSNDEEKICDGSGDLDGMGKAHEESIVERRSNGGKSADSSKGSPKIPGPASAQLLSPKQVQGLCPEAQEEYIAGVTDLCSRILHVLDEVLSAVSVYQSNATVEDIVLADMARTKKLPLYRSFREMTMWRRVARTTGRARELAKDVLQEKQDKRRKLVEEYLRDISTTCAKELGELYDSEEMDPKKVQHLLRCLQAGGDVFADLMLSR